MQKSAERVQADGEETATVKFFLCSQTVPSTWGSWQVHIALCACCGGDAVKSSFPKRLGGGPAHIVGTWYSACILSLQKALTGICGVS